MKNSKYIFALAALLITSVANATVRTLNNNNPSPGQYATWAGVEAASSIGDTIYVSGSPINYGYITVTKANILIMGTGHNPQKQNPLVSEFQHISATVGQIRIDGVKCRKVNLTPSFGAATLILKNSHVVYSVNVVTNDFDCYLELTNNVIGSEDDPFVTNGIAATLSTDNVTSAVLTGVIRNNIIHGSITARSGSFPSYNYETIANCIINNNTFITENSPGFSNVFFAVSFTNVSISNNIMLGFGYWDNLGSQSTSVQNSIVQNNLIYPTVFTANPFQPTGTINANPLLVNYPCPTWDCEYSNAYDYHLSASSPGKNAGSDGTDIGPYGGPYGATFSTYGEPSIPQMKQMNMPATVVSGGSFNVNIISTVK